MNISSPAICCFLYDADTNAERIPLTPEFYYKWDVVKSSHFQRSKELTESTKRWIDQQLSIDGEGADLVLEPRCLIKKTNLTFAAKFFCLLVCHLLSPVAADNILTWEREVLVASLVDGLEINFARLLIIVIHERDFTSSITYPFTCMIF